MVSLENNSNFVLALKMSDKATVYITSIRGQCR